ncbi:MAG TPA: HDOD domain-containing protein, partial [Spirochaetota bacterium]|nr:HDOD domain-containing protein [Spirochaetota bacterium]
MTAYANGEPVTIRFAFPEKDTLLSINSLTAQILSKRDRIFLLESVITIIRECVFNAVKANAKRVYFEREGTVITNPAEYERLISAFKEKIMMNFPDMQSPLAMSVYRAEFTITGKSDGITISVTNNVPLLAPEKQRINERIANANKYNDFTEVYDEMYDDTEGAGLGIILTILILKNSGITNAFSINADDKNTTATVTIPDTLRPHELSTKVKAQIIEQISVLPTMPHTTVELINMCDNPNTQISKMSSKITSDPSLTADILKLANSAGFFASRKIDNINEALVRIGLKNLKFMLIATSSKTILEKRYKKFESIWNHCIKTAFYARTLAQQLGLRGVDDQA